MSVKCILLEQSGKGGPSGSTIILKSLEITKYPTKTTYLSGQTFDPTGMELTASYGIAESAVVLATSIIPVTSCVISPSVITEATNYVNISYSENGVTVSTRLSVTVNAALAGIRVASAPTTSTLAWGDTFSSTGLSIVASYTSGPEKTVTSYTMKIGSVNLTDGTVMNNSNFVIGTNRVDITYTEEGETATTSFDLTITKKNLTVPSQTGSLTYNGNAQSPTLNNFNNSLMSVTGNSQTNAGSYTAIVSLRDSTHYQWSDNTTTNKNVSWSINKAAGSLSLDKTSVEITGSTLTQTVTITRAGDGAISYSPTSITGLTLSLSGNTLNITGDGSTAITSQTITVSVAAGTNYNAPSSKSFTISVEYDPWGDETAIGDAAWWAKLKTWAASATKAEREARIGKKKKVSLSSPVLGANAASMVCIGADIDGTGTLTFQTEGILPTNTSFGSNSLWNGSTAQSLCNDFGTKCSASASLKSITKLTSSIVNGNTNNPADVKTTAKCWLPSECEMGLSENMSSSAEEWSENGAKTAYPYYNSNDRRVKNVMTADGTANGSNKEYWFRSRAFLYAHGVSLVNISGMAYYDSCNNENRLAPAFVIG